MSLLLASIRSGDTTWLLASLSGSAGMGSERSANGSRNRTAWAQPSGLSLSADGGTLWVADSESSSIRSSSIADGSSQASVQPLHDGASLFYIEQRPLTGQDVPAQQTLLHRALPKHQNICP